MITIARSYALDNFTFTARCYEVLVDSSETRMNYVKAMSHALKLLQEDFIFQIPQMKPLSHYIEQSKSSRRVASE